MNLIPDLGPAGDWLAAVLVIILIGDGVAAGFRLASILIGAPG